VAKNRSLKLTENLAWMVESTFLLDSATQFKIGLFPTTELITNSNSVAWAFGQKVIISYQFTWWHRNQVLIGWLHPIFTLMQPSKPALLEV
jgi:hypothetical protein